MVALVNAARVENGCLALKVDAMLTAAAVAHSADMAARDYFSHTTPEGVTFDKRILEAGYPTPGAENIAQGQDSAEEVMDAWMKSKGHRANILNCQLTTIGVGLDTNGWYWSQDFGY
ncbi:MAG: CAP domain-containing protein [Labedaea sp.]